MQSTLPPLLQATSGAVGSAVANAIVYPLDIATTRMQHESRKANAKSLGVLTTLYKLIWRRGLSRLYRGLSADTLSTLLSKFLYFFTYTSLQKALHIYHTRYTSSTRRPAIASPAGIGGFSAKASDVFPKTSTPSPIQELLIGIIAGILSKGITLPISTVCIRQQLDEKRDSHQSTIETLEAIHHESGLSGLFAGFGPTIPLTLLPSLTLYIHTLLLEHVLPEKNRSHPPGSITFALGALSNALATVPLYPLVLVKTLNQAGSEKGKEKQGAGMIDTLQSILHRDGIKGLYTGLEGQLVKGVVQQGVMMLIKQRVEEAVMKVYRSRT